MGMSSNIGQALPAEKPTYICVIGGPGSGKTTQTRQIVEQFDFTHISTGKLLRDAIDKRSIPNWNEVEQRMNEGFSIDSEIVANLVLKYMDGLKEKKVVLDNFPMNEDNYETWKMLLQKDAKFSAIFLLEATEDEMRRRLLDRNERDDDNEVSIKQRIRIFNYETKPLLEIFRNKGLLTIFDGMKKPEVLYAEIKKEIIERKLYI